MRFSFPFVALLLPVILTAQGGPPPRDLALTPAERARFTGAYTITDGDGGQHSTFRVYEQDGALMGQIRTSDPTHLLYQGKGVFRPAASPEYEIAFGGSGSRATTVVMTAPGVTMRGTRDTTAAIPAGPVDASTSGALFDEMAQMDSLLFDAAYVACDTARVFALLTDDVEFYHDVTGFREGAQVRADFVRLAAQCPAGRGVRRELVAGTLRVYPIRTYGVVQSGEHRFVERGASTMTTARFVTLWKKTATGWQASRILSMDHRNVPVRDR